MVRTPYQSVVRLCSLAAGRWAELDTAYYNLPGGLLRQKPHRYLNLVYGWAIERVPPDTLEEWQADLVELLPWQDSQSQAAEELESASFFDMQARAGG